MLGKLTFQNNHEPGTNTLHEAKVFAFTYFHKRAVIDCLFEVHIFEEFTFLSPQQLRVYN